MTTPDQQRSERTFLWAVGLTLTVLCAALYVVQPPLVLTASNLLGDAFIRITSRAPPGDRILMLDVDEDSLDRHGQWPWPRWKLADMAGALLDAGASVLVFDMLFPEPDRSSPQALQDACQERFSLSLPLEDIPMEWRDFDLFFSRAIQGRPVVMGCEMIPGAPAAAADAGSPGDAGEGRIHILSRTKNMAALSLPSAGTVKHSIPAAQGAARQGFINALPDADGVIRRVPLVWARGEHRLYPALSLEACRLDRKEPGIAVQVGDDGIEEIRMGRRRIPTDAQGRMLLNYRRLTTNRHGLASAFPTLSAHEVLSGSFDPDRIRGRIVVAGTSAAGLRDLVRTPQTSLFSGMEVHATALDNLLAGDMLRAPANLPGWHALFILLSGVLLTAWSVNGNSRRAFAGFLILMAAWPMAGLYLLARHRLVFVPAWEMLSIAVLYPVLTTLRFWREERWRKQVRRMFQTMVSDRVLLYLENHPECFSLTGRRMEASILFTDLAGFTPLAERMPPEQVSRLLNRYHSPMANIILRREGYLDKFVGDLIMAVWGVPFATQDHAVQACRTALEMQETLFRMAPVFQEEFGCELRTRIGINSGPVTAGNMGSERRFQYTVVGDSVNVASRLEQAGKHYQVPIILGENTCRAVEGLMEVRLLDRIRVSGKSIPLSIYELLGERGTVSEKRLHVARLYEKALRACWSRQWEESLHWIEEARGLADRDMPLERLAERVHREQTSPPSREGLGDSVASVFNARKQENLHE